LNLNLPAPPVLCLLAPNAEASVADDLPAGLPEGIELFRAVPEATSVAALRACAQAHPGRDVVLLRAGTQLPPAWWKRLCAGRDGGFDVLSPLSDAIESLDPFADSRRPATVDDADACVWMLGEAQAVPCRAWLAACSLWRASALASLEQGVAEGEVPVGLQAAVLDSLYVAVGLQHARADQEPVPAAIAHLRLRIAELVGRVPAAVGRDDAPVILHVLHGWGGGVQRFVENLMSASRGWQHLALVAHGSSEMRRPGERLALYDALNAAPLNEWPLALGIGSTALASHEYADVLARILARFGVRRVLVSSLIGHGLEVLRTGLPTAVVCHDYYPLWPHLHEDFGDVARDFSPAAMSAALADPGENFNFAETRARAWQQLREDYVSDLRAARATLFCPSRVVHDNLIRIEPRLAGLAWHHIPHGMAPWPMPVHRVDPPDRSSLRVLVLGRINGDKGEVLLRQLLPLLDPRIELVLLGAGRAGMSFFGHAGVHVRMDYARDQLPELVAQLAPDLALIPATVAETFSYTLSELWSLGVPVLATRMGSLAERVQDGESGLLVEPHAAAVAAQLNVLADTRHTLATWRQPRSQTTLATMAQAYEAALQIQSRPKALAMDVIDGLALNRIHALTLSQHRLASQLDQVRAVVAGQRRELQRRGDWGDDLQAQIDDQRRWATELVADLETARQHVTRLSAELDDRSLWARSLESDLALARQEVTRLSAELDDRSLWASSLERDVDLARQEVTRLSAELDDRSLWASSLERDVDLARQEVTRLSAEMDDRSLWARSLERDVDLARQEVTRLSAELDDRSLWARSLERDVDLARQEVTRLSAELDDRSLWARSLERDVDLARQEVTRLSTELNERTTWALAMNQELTVMKNDLATAWQSLETKQNELAQMQNQLERIQEQLAERDRECAQLREWLQSAVIHGENMQRDRDLILASRSWRLTKPLRYAGRLLAATLARLRFRWQRARSLLQRTRSSLSTRGVNGTVNRIRDELRSSAPPKAAPLPIPGVSGEMDAIVLPSSDAPQVSIVIPVYNHLDTTLVCLRSLAATKNRIAHEIIVVDDCSSDATAETLPSITSLRYQRNVENLGFIGACNAGAASARGQFVVFLNNDTAVQDGWLDALIDTFEQHDKVGLVGAKLVYPDGRLQEAGGIVFADGSGWNYGRFDDPAKPEYNFVREVDYCSGAAIALRTDLFRHFGGFDAHYAPAYYEDTDLAMKVRQAGLRVLYQPASVVVHFEGISSGTDTSSGTKRYQVINKEKFLERWKDALAMHPSPALATHEGVVLARQHRSKKQVLVIDATTPQPDHDSGSVRLCNILRLLLEEGCAVTFFADNRAYVDAYSSALQQLGVEVLWHPHLSDPVDWFARNGARFDLVFVSRHYIACNYLPLVRSHARKARFAFDTVDLHYLREQRAAELAGSSEMARTAEKTREQELALIAASDVTLVVSPVEKDLLAREMPEARVEILSNVHEVFGCRRGFDERKGIWFVGGYQHPPNVDAALWFARDILPLVRAELPELEFHLVGSKAPNEVKALADLPGVHFHGFVNDIEPFLDGCRLAVAPLRYGAGVKGKVNMSMSYGQPVVATPIAVEGMFAEAERDVLVAEAPQAFAAAVLRAYRDEALWKQLSENGLANVTRHFSFEAARGQVRSLLDGGRRDRPA
jgi:GT2 family glycosyltransferase/glycosyltransferase involved in cell wall biosynthesis